MPMKYGHIPPDLTPTKQEREAEKAQWKELDGEIAQLRQRVKEWEGWYEGVVADFVGLTTDANDPQRLHDWEWMDDYRPAPYRMQMG